MNGEGVFILRDLRGTVVSSGALLPLDIGTLPAALPPPLLEAPSFNFRSSTPSLCRGQSLADPPVLSVRTVNYFIDEQTGKYKFGSKIMSTTYLWGCGGNGSGVVLTTPDTASHDNDERNIYAGVEDVRLFRASDGALYMSGTRGVRVTNATGEVRFNMCVEFGVVGVEGVAHTCLLNFQGRQTMLEKNWALLEDLTSSSPRLKMVYAWDPYIVIGDVTAKVAEVTETHCMPSPRGLRNLRGSTNGVLMADNTEWWFICHRAERRNGRRHYTHVFVVLDATTPELRFKRQSAFFTFEGGWVEYTLGFVVVAGGDLLIGYSVMDRETKFVRVPRSSVDETLFGSSSSSSSTPPVSTLCVNMIVRQEERIIRRCLEALVGVTSEFAILDTGSTDNTLAQIGAFDAFPGITGTSTFRDFSQARNEALGLSDAVVSSHLLLLDADMVLVVGPGGGDALRAFVDAAGPTAVFQLLQCHGSLEYYNLRIVPVASVRAGAIRYVGVTHEYLHVYGVTNMCVVPRDVAYIQDVSDGGCKHDKLERDIRLLTEGLAREEEDALGTRSRYTFYLAQSHNDAGNTELARVYYRARADMRDTWVEEVAYSLLQLFRLVLRERKEKEALVVLGELVATGVRRPEAFYHLAAYCREAGRNADALRYIMLAHENMPVGDNNLPLFFDTSVAYLLKFEASIVLWYMNDGWWRQKGKELCVSLLAQENPPLPADLRAVVQNNYDTFYRHLAS